MTSCTFAWDTDGDGAFDDGTGPTITRTLEVHDRRGIKVVRVKATDRAGSPETANSSVTVGTPTLPVPVIDGSRPTARSPGWARRCRSPARRPAPTGDTLPASALRWRADLLHCPAQCHRPQCDVQPVRRGLGQLRRARPRVRLGHRAGADRHVQRAVGHR